MSTFLRQQLVDVIETAFSDDYRLAYNATDQGE